MWLGGTDQASEGNFIWVSSGAPFAYTNWYPGDPDGSTGQDCALLGYHGTNQWIDDICHELTNQIATLCEILFPCNMKSD